MGLTGQAEARESDETPTGESVAVRSSNDVETGPIQEEEEEVEMPTMNIWVTLGLLAVVTVVRLSFKDLRYHVILDLSQLVAVTAEFLVDSINGLTESGHISKEFVGIILLPIVGNAAGMSLDQSHILLGLTASIRTRNCCNSLSERQAHTQHRGCRRFQHCMFHRLSLQVVLLISHRFKQIALFVIP